MRLTNEQAMLVEYGIIARALRVLAAKRHDYSGDQDPYRNFRVVGALFEGTAARPAVGATVRLLDKVARIARAAESGALRGESIFENDLPDVVNYIGIIAGLLLEAADTSDALGELLEDGYAFLQRLSGDD